jgi:hypothetical protein
MNLSIKMISFLLLLISSSVVYGEWPRWEERTIDCSNVAKTDQCILVAPKAKVARDPAQYKCHREEMPQHAWNPLAKNSKTRLACPIACEPDADLSVCWFLIRLISTD